MPEVMQPGMRRLSNLVPLTEKQMRDAMRDPIYVFNTSDREYRPVAGNKTYIIPACPEGAEVSEPLVIPGIVYSQKVRAVHGIEAEYEHHADDGIDVAKDLLGIAGFRGQDADLTRWGVFFTTTPEPSGMEIRNARAKFLSRLNDLVQAADRAYALNNGMVPLPGGGMASNIGDDAIAAAKVLGIQRPWTSTFDVKAQTACDECGTGNLETAAFCKQCDNMLNEAAAKRKFPKKYAERMQATEESDEEVQERRGPGRPRKEVVA